MIGYNSDIGRGYHLEPLLHGSSTLEVLDGGLDVLFDGLLGQINHMAGVERLAVQLEEAFVLVQQSIQPREELLGAVVGVQDDGDTVGGGNAADEMGTSNATGDGRLLAIVTDALAGEVSSTALGQLQNDGAVLIAGSLERGHGGGRGGYVLDR